MCQFFGMISVDGLNAGKYLVEDEETGVSILNKTGSLNITYYDASYLAEAHRFNKTLVTDDEKLAKAQRRQQ